MSRLQRAIWIAYILLVLVSSGLAISGPPRDVQAGAVIAIAATAVALALHHLLKPSERPRV